MLNLPYIIREITMETKLRGEKLRGLKLRKFFERMPFKSSYKKIKWRLIKEYFKEIP